MKYQKAIDLLKDCLANEEIAQSDVAKAIIGQLGEFYYADSLGTTLLTKATKGIDVVIGKRKVQIKTYITSKSRSIGLNHHTMKLATDVAIIRLSKDGDIEMLKEYKTKSFANLSQDKAGTRWVNKSQLEQ
jgi:hypothetical protein